MSLDRDIKEAKRLRLTYGQYMLIKKPEPPEQKQIPNGCKVCPICSNVFRPVYGHTKYCSGACMDIAREQNHVKYGKKRNKNGEEEQNVQAVQPD